MCIIRSEREAKKRPVKYAAVAHKSQLAFLSLWKIVEFRYPNFGCRAAVTKRAKESGESIKLMSGEVPSESEMEKHAKSPPARISTVSCRSVHTKTKWMWFRRIWNFAGKFLLCAIVNAQKNENGINPWQDVDDSRCTEFDFSRCTLCTCQFTFIMRSKATPCHKGRHSAFTTIQNTIVSCLLCARVCNVHVCAVHCAP